MKTIVQNASLGEPDRRSMLTGIRRVMQSLDSVERENLAKEIRAVIS